MRRNRAGFTLAELLIVVAIIAVLVAVAVPVFSNQLECAREAVDVNNLRAAYSAARIMIMTEPEAIRTHMTNSGGVYLAVYDPKDGQLYPYNKSGNQAPHRGVGKAIVGGLQNTGLTEGLPYEENVQVNRSGTRAWVGIKYDGIGNRKNSTHNNLNCIAVYFYLETGQVQVKFLLA